MSYSFSNEPSVVKRAWLFGETICPVGMHTKDKSKAAAATLSRPLKKVEDILREKSLVALDANESVFTNDDDSYFDILSHVPTNDEAIDEVGSLKDSSSQGKLIFVISCN